MGCCWNNWNCNRWSNCNNNCSNNCNSNCNSGCDDDDDCAEERRRAYWAGFRDGCRNPRCRWRNDGDCD